MIDDVGADGIGLVFLDAGIPFHHGIENESRCVAKKDERLGVVSLRIQIETR